MIERNRQAVSPFGEITEERSTIELDSVSPRSSRPRPRSAGSSRGGGSVSPPTQDYVGSDVVLLEAV